MFTKRGGDGVHRRASLSYAGRQMQHCSPITLSEQRAQMSNRDPLMVKQSVLRRDFLCRRDVWWDSLLLHQPEEVAQLTDL